VSPFHIVVCGSIVPDPLQTLDPVSGAQGPGLRNEAMLPHVLDPWAAHALFEAAHLARQATGSRVWLVSMAPKGKLQQVMMTLAQKAPFELVAIDGSASGFTDAGGVAEVLADGIAAIPGLDRTRLLVFGGWESASRCAGATLQIVGERLGITDQFQGVDRLTVTGSGELCVLERVEGGRHQVSVCAGPPAVLGWATGYLREPPNSPQIGMANMRGIMPSLQRAVTSPRAADGLSFARVSLPSPARTTKVVKDRTPDEIAREIVDWMTGGSRGQSPKPKAQSPKPKAFR
jgi:electron transfer flavoprotein beta subunit